MEDLRLMYDFLFFLLEGGGKGKGRRLCLEGRGEGVVDVGC